MRILIATDKFKGSLSGPQVAAALAAGLDGHVVESVPVADGGEGTVDAALGAGFDERFACVAGPTGRPVDARYAQHGDEAVIEMAAASGLALLPDGRLAPLKATSRGAGELIRAALEAGATSIVLGVGGSACTDGGAGLLAALGAEFMDKTGEPLGDGGAELTRLQRVRLTSLDPRLADARLVLASDVDNPLLGRRGAAAVFAPQKGATESDVQHLEAALSRYVSVLHAVRRDAAELAFAPGAGAAGGVGYAALLLGARMEPGTDVVQRLTGLQQRLVNADLVITGEGSLDEQTLGGKAPVGVAAAARRAGVPVVAVCGRTTLSADQLSSAGFAAVYPLSELEPDVSRSIRNAAELLTRVGAAIAVDADRLTATRTTSERVKEPDVV